MKKGHVIILLSFLLLLVLAGAYSYSKYTTDVTGNAEIKIAKWNISVNGCPGDESGAIECSTSTEGNDYTVNVVVGNDSTKQIIAYEQNQNVTNSYVRPGLFSPGTTGTFDLVIKPNDTDVSFDYEIKFNTLQIYDANGDKKDFNDPNIVLKVDDQVITPGSTATINGTMLLNDFKNNASYERRLVIKVIWNYVENQNTEDTELGMSSGIPKLFVPFEITFTQKSS